MNAIPWNLYEFQFKEITNLNSTDPQTLTGFTRYGAVIVMRISCILWFYKLKIGRLCQLALSSSDPDLRVQLLVMFSKPHTCLLISPVKVAEVVGHLVKGT